MRSDKEILLATRPFAAERPWLSWWHLGSTLVVLAGLFAVVLCDAPWMLRLPFSILAGLAVVRLFVLYHDQQHGVFLGGSRAARWLMTAVGLAILSPPSVWRRSHDHHHAHNSKSFGPNVGSFPLLTVDSYRRATRRQRLLYAASRHPLTIACGYLTAFLFGMCLVPLIANPRRHPDAALSLAGHGGLLAWLAARGADDFVLAGLIPFTVGSALGAYLFFAQHNFPGARLRTGRDWSHLSAALGSSSYMRMGAVMRWLTANIGYHHVHHANARIPFYRLPEAMAAIPELQSPGTTSLRPADVIACLRLKLWDEDAQRLVPWPADSRDSGAASRTAA